jgi:hypothetical protein
MWEPLTSESHFNLSINSIFTFFLASSIHLASSREFAMILKFSKKKSNFVPPSLWFHLMRDKFKIICFLKSPQTTISNPPIHPPIPKKRKKKKKKIIDHILINISKHLVVGPSILNLLQGHPSQFTLIKMGFILRLLWKI